MSGMYPVNDHTLAQVEQVRTVTAPYGLKVSSITPKMGVNAKTGKAYKPKSASYYVHVKETMETLGILIPRLASIQIDAGSSAPELSYVNPATPVSISLDDFAEILKTATDPYRDNYNTPEELNRVILILQALERFSITAQDSLPSKEELALFEASKLLFPLKVKALNSGVSFEELANYDDLTRDQVKALLNI